MGVELDLETAAGRVALAQPGQDEVVVLFDEIAVDVQEDGVDGQALDDGFLEEVEEVFALGDDVVHLVCVRRRRYVVCAEKKCTAARVNGNRKRGLPTSGFRVKGLRVY